MEHSRKRKRRRRKRERKKSLVNVFSENWDNAMETVQHLKCTSHTDESSLSPCTCIGWPTTSGVCSSSGSEFPFSDLSGYSPSYVDQNKVNLKKNGGAKDILKQ